MKKAWFFVLILVFSVSTAWAQGVSRPFETVDQARQRHSAERYETYKNRGYQAPLGGYSERLGDPAPHGTENPGFVGPGSGKPSHFGPLPESPNHGHEFLDED